MNVEYVERERPLTGQRLEGVEEGHRVRATRDCDKNSFAANEHLVAANRLDHSCEDVG